MQRFRKGEERHSVRRDEAEDLEAGDHRPGSHRHGHQGAHRSQPVVLQVFHRHTGLHQESDWDVHRQASNLGGWRLWCLWALGRHDLKWLHNTFGERDSVGGPSIPSKRGPGGPTTTIPFDFIVTVSVKKRSYRERLRKRRMLGSKPSASRGTTLQSPCSRTVGQTTLMRPSSLPRGVTQRRSRRAAKHGRRSFD